MKKLLFIIVITILIFGFNVSAADEEYSGLQLNYPTIGDSNMVRTPGQTPLLPEYVDYIFNLLIYSSGLILMWIFILAGFDYYTSAGNAGVMGDAKDRMIKGLLGFIILFLSNILITTINPSLADMSLEPFLSGLTARNKYNDGIVAVYAIPSFTFTTPPADTLLIPKKMHQSGESRIISFSKENLQGKATILNGKDFFKCNDPDSDECVATIKSNMKSVFYLPIRTGVYIIMELKTVDEDKTVSKTQVPFLLSKSSYRNLYDIKDFASLNATPIGIRTYVAPEDSNDTAFAILLFNDTDHEREGVLYLPPPAVTIPFINSSITLKGSGWWPGEYDTKKFEDIKTSANFKKIVATLAARGNLFLSRALELEKFSPRSLKIIKYNPDHKQAPTTAAFYDSPEFIQSEESTEDDQYECALDQYGSDETGITGHRHYDWLTSVITCKHFQPTSVRINQGEAILLHAYTLKEASDKDGATRLGSKHDTGAVADEFIVFYRAAHIKYSDPNLTDNKGIGKCNCQKRNWWTLGMACGVWQPCPNTIFHFMPSR